MRIYVFVEAQSHLGLRSAGVEALPGAGPAERLGAGLGCVGSQIPVEAKLKRREELQCAHHTGRWSSQANEAMPATRSVITLRSSDESRGPSAVVRGCALGENWFDERFVAFEIANSRGDRACGEFWALHSWSWLCWRRQCQRRLSSRAWTTSSWCCRDR